MTTMWRLDPVWERLHKQQSWGVLVRNISLYMQLSVEVKYTPTSRNYHCQLHKLEPGKTGYYRQFIGEGFADHVLGSLRLALVRSGVKIAPQVRSTLLEAMIDYLVEEMA